MKTIKNQKVAHRIARHRRIRAKVKGTATMPRLAVFRSNRFIVAQIIDDEKGVTLCSAGDLKEKKGTKIERASAVGKAIADAAKGKKVTAVVFDRGGFLYTGRVKALADAAREAGLTF
jgi:large subunit ribosomal protein L18